MGPAEGAEVVRVLGRTDIPLTVYDDSNLLPADPRAMVAVDRQVGGADPASAPVATRRADHSRHRQRRPRPHDVGPQGRRGGRS
jgi:hypothetical protein